MHEVAGLFEERKVSVAGADPVGQGEGFGSLSSLRAVGTQQRAVWASVCCEISSNRRLIRSDF